MSIQVLDLFTAASLHGMGPSESIKMSSARLPSRRRSRALTKNKRSRDGRTDGRIGCGESPSLPLSSLSSLSIYYGVLGAVMDDLLSLHTPTEYFLRLLLCSPTKRGHERQICFNLNQQLVCLPLACWDRSLLASPPRAPVLLHAWFRCSSVF